MQIYICRNRLILLLSEFALNWCYDRYVYNIINCSVSNDIKGLILIDKVECCPNTAIGLVVKGCCVNRLDLLVRPDHTLYWECHALIHIHLPQYWESHALTHIHLSLYWECHGLIHILLPIYCECNDLINIHLPCHSIGSATL